MAPPCRSVAAGAYVALTVPVSLLSGLTAKAAGDDLIGTAPFPAGNAHGVNFARTSGENILMGSVSHGAATPYVSTRANARRGGAMFSGARRVLRFLLIALMSALFAGTAAADEDLFICGKTFVTVPAYRSHISIRRADVRMMMPGIDGHDGSLIGIVVYMNPETGRRRG